MKVEVLNKFGKQEKGSVINVPDSVVKVLIKKGIVKESNKPLTKQTKKVSKDTIETK